MATIFHRLAIKASPEATYKALTQAEGLSQWWARSTGASEVGNTLSFFFGPNGEFELNMAVEALEENQKVVWRCTNGPWAEMGQFTFRIEAHEGGTMLAFSHEGWPEQNDFYGHCNSKWGYFLVTSLKNLLENGQGQPHPADPDI